MVDENAQTSKEPTTDPRLATLLEAAQAAFGLGNYRESQRVIKELDAELDAITDSQKQTNASISSELTILKSRLKPEPLNLFIVALAAVLLIAITCAAYLDAL